MMRCNTAVALTASLVIMMPAGAVANDAPSNPFSGKTFTSIESIGTEIPGKGRLELSFTESRVTGFAGCNHVSGEVKISRARIDVGPLLKTMLKCDKVGDAQDLWLHNILVSDPAYTYQDGVLTLELANSATVVMRPKTD